MNLTALIPADTAHEWNVAQSTRAAEIDVTGITCDSRLVEQGNLFAALSGVQTDGAQFIDQAIDKGAAVVLAGQGTTSDYADRAGVPLIAVSNPRRAYAIAAAQFFGRQPEIVAAVTGTNGKSSIADFLRQIWTGVGLRAPPAWER